VSALLLHNVVVALTVSDVNIDHFNDAVGKFFQLMDRTLLRRWL